MNPKCPHCGAEMTLRLTEYSDGTIAAAYYECPVCEADSPYIEDHIADDIKAAALSAALQRYVEPNRVLTLAELDAMNGEPVFIQGGDGEEFWMIADQDWMFEIDYDPDFINMEYNDPAGHFGLHVLGWRALKRRPTDAERSAAKWRDAE